MQESEPKISQMTGHCLSIQNSGVRIQNSGFWILTTRVIKMTQSEIKRKYADFLTV